MTPEGIGAGTIKGLAELRTGGGPTLSVHLDLEMESLSTSAARWSGQPCDSKRRTPTVRDLYALMMPVGDGALPTAGIPWYVAPFGRDSMLGASRCSSSKATCG